MTLHVSHHAIERYQRRWRPDLSFQDAGVELRTLVAMAKPIRETSARKGHELYAVGNVKLVITRNTDDRRPLVVTVLPHFDPVDVVAEIVAFQEERLMEAASAEPPSSTRRSAPCPTEEDIEAAEDAYRRAGQDMFHAETLIADGKKMLADAERRRALAKRVLKPGSNGGGR